MPVRISATRNLDDRREFIYSTVLPDTCALYSISRATDMTGAWSETNVQQTWRGQTAIPCRLDPTAHYRSENIFEQEALVNEYTLWLPYDAPVAPDMVLVISGVNFNFIKVLKYHSANILIECTVNEVR